MKTEEFGLIDLKDDYSEPEFTLYEVLEMEKSYRAGNIYPTLELSQELAARFSCSEHRSGKSVITWEQVSCWFRDRKDHLSKAITSSLLVPKETFYSRMRSPPRTEKHIGDISSDLSELTFEARSARDCAWYDVDSFINYRVVSSGELEVRVRFAGFSNAHDEWLNVRRDVRDRSIPMEASECNHLKVGDLVLSYRQNEDHALYSDAYVEEIERRIHDGNCCSCKIWLRFDYDNSKEIVDLTNICRRPSS